MKIKISKDRCTHRMKYSPLFLSPLPFSSKNRDIVKRKRFGALSYIIPTIKMESGKKTSFNATVIR